MSYKILLKKIPLFSLLFGVFLVGTALAAEDSNLTSGEETINDYTRVFIQDSTGKRFISQENFNDFHSQQAGEYLVWSREINGLGQIFRYNITTGSTLQLTYSSNNLEPVVDIDGNVAWLRWDGVGWQVYLFDGLKISKISRKFTSESPLFSNGVLIYSVRNEKGSDWNLQAYDLASAEYVAVPENYNVSSPSLVDRSYFYEVSSVSLEYLLGKLSSSSSSTSSEDWVDSSDIEEEIEDLLQLKPEQPASTSDTSQSGTSQPNISQSEKPLDPSEAVSTPESSSSIPL